jgi:hypothetical protein
MNRARPVTARRVDSRVEHVPENRAQNRTEHPTERPLTERHPTAQYRTEQIAARSARGWLLLGSWIMLSGCAEVLDIPTEPRLVRDGMKERSGMWSHSGTARKHWGAGERVASPVVPLPDAAADLSIAAPNAAAPNAADSNAAERATDDAARPPVASGSLSDQNVFASLDAGPDALLAHTAELPQVQRVEDARRAGAARR